MVNKMPLNTQIKSQNVNIRFNFQKVVLPILKVLRLFGFAVFKINREGNLQIKFFRVKQKKKKKFRMLNKILEIQNCDYFPF